MKLKKVKGLSMKGTKKSLNKTMKSIKASKILKELTTRGNNLLTGIRKLTKK